MGGLMGGGSSNAANQANAQAQQDAADARTREAEHQAMLKSGYEKIQNIFTGAPVMANRNAAFNWGDWGNRTSQFGTYAGAGGQIDGTQVPGLPPGYTYKTIPGTSTTTVAAPGQAARGTVPYDETVGTASQRAAGNISTNPNVPGYQTVRGTPGGAGTTTTGATTYGVLGPDGRVYKPGEAINYNESYDTGQRTGGFDDAFYKGIADNVTKAGETDITDQYNKARSNLTYALARQGLSVSGAANQGVADLTKSKGTAETDLANQAADAVNTVKGQVEQQKQAAINELYATSDPTVASNSALTNATNIRANKPAYQGLGDIFSGVIQGFGTLANAGMFGRGGGGGGAYFKNMGFSSPFANSAGGS